VNGPPRLSLIILGATGSQWFTDERTSLAGGGREAVVGLGPGAGLDLVESNVEYPGRSGKHLSVYLCRQKRRRKFIHALAAEKKRQKCQGEHDLRGVIPVGSSIGQRSEIVDYRRRLRG
jgi:hypothetical protein